MKVLTEQQKEKLQVIDSLGILGSVRQRLGAEDENDESHDGQIVEMSASQIIAKHCGWELGDESWAKSFIQDYLYLAKNGFTDSSEEYI